MADDANANEVEVLPANGTQWALDKGYLFLEFIKAHAISLAIGVAIGILISNYFERKTRI